MRRRLWLAAALLAAGCDPTLPPAAGHAHVRAPAPPIGMDLCWLEYGTDTQPGSYGLAGASDHEHWEVTFSGLLIRHPRGHLLLEAGHSKRFSEDIESAGFFSRQLLDFVQGGGTRIMTAPEVLRLVGEPPAALAAIVVSHVHGDHVGGIVDLPGLPVLLSREELAFARRQRDAGGFHVVRTYARALEVRGRAIEFTDRPYANFDRSADHFGDGSVVFVPLYGHTPGSIGTFVNRSAAERYFHVGDAVNTLEAIEKRRGKSVVVEFTDADSERADAVVSKLSQLHAQDPALAILPAHDRNAWRQAFGAPARCLGASPRATRER